MGLRDCETSRRLPGLGCSSHVILEMGLPCAFQGTKIKSVFRQSNSSDEFADVFRRIRGWKDRLTDRKTESRMLFPILGRCQRVFELEVAPEGVGAGVATLASHVGDGQLRAIGQELGGVWQTAVVEELDE